MLHNSQDFDNYGAVGGAVVEGGMARGGVEIGNEDFTNTTMAAHLGLLLVGDHICVDGVLVAGVQEWWWEGRCWSCWTVLEVEGRSIDHVA